MIALSVSHPSYFKLETGPWAFQLEKWQVKGTKDKQLVAYVAVCILHARNIYWIAFVC